MKQEIFSKDRVALLQVVTEGEAVGNVVTAADVIYEFKSKIQFDGFEIYSYRRTKRCPECGK